MVGEKHIYPYMINLKRRFINALRNCGVDILSNNGMAIEAIEGMVVHMTTDM